MNNEVIEQNREPEWLIRDNANVIRGPYFAREVLQLLKKGQLKGKTELCKSNSYWFYAEERAELEKFFPDITITDTKRIHTGTHSVSATRTLLEGGLSATAPTPVPAVSAEDLPPERARPERTAAVFSAPSPHVLVMPQTEIFSGVDHEEPTEEIEAPVPEHGKRLLWLAGGTLALAAAAAFLFLGKGNGRPTPAALPRAQQVTETSDPLGGLSLDKRVLSAFLANDLVQAERALEQVEEKKKKSAEGHLIRAMIKRRFQFDIDGALASLDQARGAAGNSRQAAFVDLLRGVYLMQKDPAAAVNVFASVTDETMLPAAQWNLAVALLTLQKQEEAARAIEAAAKRGEAGAADFLRAWLGDLRTPGDTAVEAHLQKAQAAGAEPAQTRLLLGLHKLRRGQLTAAEESFRQFIDLLPELDSEAAVREPQRLNPDAVYPWAALQIRDVHGLSSSNTRRPSAVVMAALAMLTAMEGRLKDAFGILDTAARVGGGGLEISKVMAYLKWKEAQYQDAADFLQALGDGSRDAVMDYLYGRALLKSGRADEAVRPLEAASLKLLNRSDVLGHLAEALAVSKRDVDAKAAAQRAIAINPFESSAAGVLSRLGEHSFLDREEYRTFLPLGEI